MTDRPTPLTDALSTDPAIERRDVPSRVWREMAQLERQNAELREALEGLCSIVQYSVNRLDASGNQPQVAGDLAVNLSVALAALARKQT